MVIEMFRGKVHCISSRGKKTASQRGETGRSDD